MALELVGGQPLQVLPERRQERLDPRLDVRGRVRGRDDDDAEAKDAVREARAAVDRVAELLFGWGGLVGLVGWLLAQVYKEGV